MFLFFFNYIDQGCTENWCACETLINKGILFIPVILYLLTLIFSPFSFSLLPLTFLKSVLLLNTRLLHHHDYDPTHPPTTISIVWPSPLDASLTPLLFCSGGDDVQQLCDAGEEEFLEIMALVGMASKPLHVRRLQKSLQEWLTNPGQRITKFLLIFHQNRWQAFSLFPAVSIWLSGLCEVLGA